MSYRSNLGQLCLQFGVVCPSPVAYISQTQAKKVKFGLRLA